MYKQTKIRKWIKYDFDELRYNPNAYELLNENVNWDYLCKKCDNIEFIKRYPYKIRWYYLSENPNAIELLKANKEKD
jgi:hypothetical protein